MCYVGKATKVFFGVAAVLVASGLVFGFGVFHHGLRRGTHGCEGTGCGGGSRPAYPDPMPAAATAAAAPPIPSSSYSAPPSLVAPPAAPAPPGVPTTSTASPPPVPGVPTVSAASPPAISRPGDAATVAQGPGPFLAQNNGSS